MEFSVQTDIDRAIKQLASITEAKQLRFAVAKALTDTAHDVRQAEIRELRDSIDRPRDITLKSVYVRKATKATLEAVVGIDQFGRGKGIAPAKYLHALIHGGKRRQKRHEVALSKAGLLPPGAFTIPGDAAKMDAHGNMQGGQIVQILAYFRAFPEAGYRANMNDKGRARLAKGNAKKGRRGVSYFVGRPGNGRLPLGVWQRVNTGFFGSAVRPVLIFARTAGYQRGHFDFYYAAELAAKRNFPRRLDEALRYAMATAR